MKLFRILLIAAIPLLIVSSAAIASDFSWTRDFNILAKSDMSGFKKRMATRFDLSDIQVVALRNIFASPADAYIMLRFGEMQGGLKKISKEQALEAVKKYRSNKGKSWEVLAKSLGVELESEEFLALKLDHDLHDANDHDRVAYSNYDRSNIN